MKTSKQKLIKIVNKSKNGLSLSPGEIETIIGFEINEKENNYISLLKRIAVPIAILFGILLAAFTGYFEEIEKSLPDWTNMPTPVFTGADYIWGFIGEPVGKANIIYHLPNIILYSFGIVGLKKIFDAIDRKTWLDNVIKTKEEISINLEKGLINFSLKKGHSILFVGNGDFIGMQFSLNNPSDQVITVSESKPAYSNVWNYFNSDSGFEDLEKLLKRSDFKSSGEYVFFPVKDDQVFLPGPNAYDLSPHKIDIFCQDIRAIENKNNIKHKRIIIVGDRFHKSLVFSEDNKKRIINSKDEVSLESVSKKHKYVVIIDPTDLVIKTIIKTSNGRKIVFRATEGGLLEYKKRFYFRLNELGYKKNTSNKEILTIGYDIFEDQTEQQTLAKKINDYYPVVLSKIVKDALIRNGYKDDEFIYVPDLVLKELNKKAKEQ